MRRTILNGLALLVVAAGGSRLLGQSALPGEEADEARVCCTSASLLARCCGRQLCRAGEDRCCADGGCAGW